MANYQGFDMSDTVPPINLDPAKVPIPTAKPVETTPEQAQANAQNQGQSQLSKLGEAIPVAAAEAAKALTPPPGHGASIPGAPAPSGGNDQLSRVVSAYLSPQNVASPIGYAGFHY